MIRTLLFSILFCFSSFSFSQNLVQNGDFEDVNNTLCGLTQTTSDFDNTMLFWLGANIGTPDIFFTTIDSTCWNYQPNSEYTGPIGIKGSQEPHSDDTFIGFFAYTIDTFDQRDYIQVQLSSPMETGSTYIVEFYVSLADSTEFSVDNVGAYLSLNPIFASNDGVLDFTPQVQFETFVDDTENWVRIADTIIAEGDFDYITIGNFNDDENTSTQANSSAGDCVGCYGAYYFLDDVSITEYLGNSIDEIKWEKVIRSYPNPLKSILHISSEYTLQKVEIKIYDASGKIVFTKSLGDGIEFTINLEDLQKGVYFMDVNHIDGMHTTRLIKLED